MARVPFDSPEIWNCIRQAGIQPPGDIEVAIWSRLLQVQAPFQPAPPKVFVLFSPKLTDAKLQSMITLLKKFKVPCGFHVTDAFFNDKIFVVGDVADEDLVPLVNSPAEIARVSTKTALKANLEQILG